MAKTDNLIDFLGDVADAIREKKETTEPIAAQNFADEIKSIETSSYKYYDIRSQFPYWIEPNFALPRFCVLGKFYDGEKWTIVDSTDSGNVGTGAVMIDPNLIYTCNTNGFTGNVYEHWLNNFGWPDYGVDLASFPEITEEEFYDLTWEPLYNNEVG